MKKKFFLGRKLVVLAGIFLFGVSAFAFKPASLYLLDLRFKKTDAGHQVGEKISIRKLVRNVRIIAREPQKDSNPDQRDGSRKQAYRDLSWTCSLVAGAGYIEVIGFSSERSLAVVEYTESSENEAQHEAQHCQDGMVLALKIGLIDQLKELKDAEETLSEFATLRQKVSVDGVPRDDGLMIHSSQWIVYLNPEMYPIRCSAFSEGGTLVSPIVETDSGLLFSSQPCILDTHCLTGQSRAEVVGEGTNGKIYFTHLSEEFDPSDDYCESGSQFAIDKEVFKALYETK